MKTYFKTGILTVLALLAAGCTEGDRFEPGREIVLFTGTDDSPVIKVDGDSYGLTVSATGKATEDITVYFRYDESVLEQYNAANKTTYRAVPESAVSIESDHMVIPAGSAASAVNTVSIISHDHVEEGYIYVIPFVLDRVEGGDYEILSSTSSILIRPTNEFKFAALDIDNSNMSSNYIFPDDKAIELSTYTYEIKFYAYSLKETGTDAICRLCAWEGAAEELANMLRFGENGYEGNSLQLVSPAGNIVSNTLFEPGRWYMLSLVYDGSTMTMYVDGEPEERKGTGDGSTIFQRFEMGMSWQGYPALQLFSGRIAEMRLWNRALSVTEMKEGVCNVPADSEGLLAYWKFNEGEGHIFHDATGNGYDMDWSDTYRDAGSGSLEPFDKGAIAEGQWTSADDPINVCRN